MSDSKTDDTIRLGGMALPNGVLVHGPSSWACAIRGENGQIQVAAEYKRFRAANVNAPFLRGPARLAEALAVLPQIKRALPAARLPMQSPRVLGSMLGATVLVRVIQPKISVDAATAPSCAAARAWFRTRSGASPASMLPIADVTTSGPTRWPPQRSCSFFAFGPCS